jgi:hypothetical protein
MTLDRDDVEAIARRVVELLDGSLERRARYIDAATLAHTLGVEREWIYAHSAQLGAIRLGGPHGRLRFDLEHVRRILGGDESPSAARLPRSGPRSRHREMRPALDRRARSS